ncbi:SGNH/GDSL hydrolase family protein [Bosea sp. TWI1241]|uniref:SGNH/GDSL hydrolase family protein n=1 Tax=Bosea sp. TWI1241 TaxID=3148904 RepID=UPI00320A6E03
MRTWFRTAHACAFACAVLLLGPLFASSSAMAASFVCRPRPIIAADPAAGSVATGWQGVVRPLRILAIGSSSTEGVGASGGDKTYPARLAVLLRDGLSGRQIDMVNAGIGGEIAPQTLQRLKAALAASRYDLVIWQVGTNDAVTGGDLEAFRKLVADGIGAARAAGTRMVVLDPQFYPGIKETARYRSYVEAIAEIARGAGVPVLSRYAAMREWYERDAEGFMAALAGDRFHMSDAGYACLAQDIAMSLLGNRPTVAVAAGE